MTARVHYPEIKWRTRILVETRRQRRTGKIIFRAWTISPYGKSYIEYDDPLWLAQSMFGMMQHGCVVEWKGEPRRGVAAEVTEIPVLRGNEEA
ncbi:hypothetical protein [Bradyrhizobium sp. DASA03120]|uniref:hypothetical protein n=1 Tax=Bradyrhizobium sp. SMVTL-02 TaxID=3395917 RepID=UPI003F6F60A2